MNKLQSSLLILAVASIMLTVSCGGKNEKDNVKNKNESKLENDNKTEEGDTTYEIKTSVTEEEIINSEYSGTEQTDNYSG